MLIYGRNVAYEILNLKPEIIKKIYIQSGFDDRNVISLIEKNKFNIKTLSRDQMDNLANGVHQGIILDVSDYKYFKMDDIKEDANFIVMLDHIEDPHNFGAIIRTCEAAGVEYIIVPQDREVLVNSTVMKTSAGSLIRSKIVKVPNLSNAISKLKDMGFWIYASAMDGEDFTEIDYSSKTCLIIGNEGKGISPIVRKNSDYIVSIPMKGVINSLNASVATGILIYEVVRNRK